MRTVILVLVLIVAGAEMWKRYGDRVGDSSFMSAITAEPSEPVERGVVVYGRDSCNYTSQMRRALAERGVAFEYRVVDQSVVADSLHARMTEQGISTKRYNLPVLQIDGDLSVRPTPDAVIGLLIAN